MDESQGEQFEGEEDEVESIGRLVRETILFILPENEILVGEWALIEGSGDADQIDTVLLLTKFALQTLTSFLRQSMVILSHTFPEQPS